MTAQVKTGQSQEQQAHAHLADFIDFGHLERYTMGEPALTQELLGMFCAEVKRFAEADRATRAAERAAVHRLKGTARAIGAFPLAEAAGWLEKLLNEDAPEEDVRDARLDLQVQLDALRDACRQWKELMHVA